MIDATKKPFLTLELRCGCGGSLFAECPQDPSYGVPLPSELVKLAVAWTQAHAAHHQEPKRG